MLIFLCRSCFWHDEALFIRKSFPREEYHRIEGGGQGWVALYVVLLQLENSEFRADLV